MSANDYVAAEMQAKGCICDLSPWIGSFAADPDCPVHSKSSTVLSKACREVRSAAQKVSAVLAKHPIEAESLGLCAGALKATADAMQLHAARLEELEGP